MTDNQPIGLKSVAELLGFSFFIPSYQRGYRWKPEQVTDLLKDINEFVPKDIPETGDRTWYCLQPVVVKQSGDVWNVIDGQQRLTTIYLILHYLNQGYAESRRTPLFGLSYQTRPGSAAFLREQLGTNDDEANRGNIDFWHISEAYKSIDKWFRDADPTFDLNRFESKFKHSTQVIWYETDSDDEIAIFTRLNIGKIKLTDAELIKALFLNSSNFIKTLGDKTRLRQIEIAAQWDAMEYALQQQGFWYFLTGGEDTLATRIEFLFRLMANKPKDKEDYDTFRVFNARVKGKNDEGVLAQWLEIRQYYQTLEEWFTDRYYYHIIGFLIATGTDIRDLLKLNGEWPTKQAFRTELTKLVKEKVNAKLENVEYKKGPVRNILLLHNIITMQQNDKTSRFPFDRYKKEKWDIEHISAVAEDAPASDKHREDWLKEVVAHLPEGVLKDKAAVYNSDTFISLYEEIVAKFIEGEPNEIANLTLLDANTNRSYGKSVFPVKRSKIIDKDKLGAFIPVCTRNVFMKFYTKEVEHMSFWGDVDREAYLTDIKEVLAIYLPK
jgi:hypothetical protein